MCTRKANRQMHYGHYEEFRCCAKALPFFPWLKTITTHFPSQNTTAWNLSWGRKQAVIIFLRTKSEVNLSRMFWRKAWPLGGRWNGKREERVYLLPSSSMAARTTASKPFHSSPRYTSNGSPACRHPLTESRKQISLQAGIWISFHFSKMKTGRQ